MRDAWKTVQLVAESQNGYVSTKDIEDAGLSRVHLRSFVENALLFQVGRGLYALPDTVIDDFAVIQRKSQHIIFSHGTALYLWGMSDRTPHFIDFTVPQGKNVSRIGKSYSDIRVHYIKPELHKIGLTTRRTPMGNLVQVYDKERCICDLIRARKHTEMQLFTQAIKDYFRNQPDLRKLLKYGKQFDIEDRIRTYSEVLA